MYLYILADWNKRNEKLYCSHVWYTVCMYILCTLYILKITCRTVYAFENVRWTSIHCTKTHCSLCFSLWERKYKYTHVSTETIFGNDLVAEVNYICLEIKIGDRKLSLLLHADDIVLMSDSEEKLQLMLDTAHSWCKNVEGIDKRQ